MTDKITLLYVDDEPINLILFEVNFKKKYNVFTAASGYEGLTCLKSNPSIMVVVSDLKMPGMNGLEFVKHAKRDFPNIIFFILTGYGLTEEISAAIEEKMINKYFSKPFNINEMANSIDESVR
jgi:two-component system, response regulator, stage 0 sporulation protein F